MTEDGLLAIMNLYFLSTGLGFMFGTLLSLLMLFYRVKRYRGRDNAITGLKN